MDGVTILNTISAVEFPWGVIIPLLLISIIGCIIGGVKDNDGLKGVSAVVCVLMLATICFDSHHSHPVQYEVSITDEVSFNEFAQHYKIIDQHGEIYVVEERTMKGSN